MNDLRWFAPNPYASLIVPELRRRGLSVALDGSDPARLALAMSATVATQAWRYAHARGCPLVLYIWDLHPEATSSGYADPVWWVAGHFLRLLRPIGGFPSRRGYYSRLRYMAARAEEVWVPSEMTRVTMESRYGLRARRVPYCYDSDRFRPGPGVREEPATLLTVSRLQPYKNQAATLRAAARLGRNLQVRFIGRPRRGLPQPLRRVRPDPDRGCGIRHPGGGLGHPTPSGVRRARRYLLSPGRRRCSRDRRCDRAGLHCPDTVILRDLSIPSAAERFEALLRPLLK